MTDLTSEMLDEIEAWALLSRRDSERLSWIAKMSSLLRQPPTGYVVHAMESDLFLVPAELSGDLTELSVYEQHRLITLGPIIDSGGW